MNMRGTALIPLLERTALISLLGITTLISMNKNGFLNVIHVKTKDQMTDCLSKAILKTQFLTSIAKLGLINIYPPS